MAVLASIVTVHEAGHYLTSKLFNITTEEFSVGFGPKLASFTLFRDEFNLRALPLGGYVKFPENYNTTLAREVEEAEYEEASAFVEENRPDRSFGARLLNAVTLGALDDKLWSDEKNRRREQQQAAAAAGTAAKDRSLPWWKKLAGGRGKDNAKEEAAKILGEIEYYDDPNLLQNRPWQQRAVVLSGGIVFNMLLSFCIYFGQINFGSGLPVPVFDNGVVVTAAPQPDAAARGILNRGDVIVAVDGHPITVSTGGGAADSQKALGDFIARIRATPDGQSLRLQVRHPDQPAGAAAVDTVTVQPQRKAGDGPQTIGVLLSPNLSRMDVLKTSNPVEAANLSLRYVASLTRETASGLMSFFAGLVTGGSGGGAGAGAQVSGPIGLIKTGSEVVASQDWTAVLLFAAAISINLGVINALPLPALDGGQLVFVLAEAVSGRKVNQRFQEGLTGVAVFFLLLLSAGTFVGDLTAIFGR